MVFETGDSNLEKAPTTTKEVPTYYTTGGHSYQTKLRWFRLAAVKLGKWLFLAFLIYRFALPVRPVTPPLHAKYSKASLDDPASEFADDDFPLRAHEPWDISVDFPHPRTLSYEVTEGTWLRLDVHPVSGDIVFDMAGDVYCLPGDAYLGAAGRLGGRTEAVPVLTGVPHDADPRFSPAGDKLAFKSDAGLGADNLWVMPWAADGCTAMDVRAHVSSSHELELKIDDEEKLTQGMKETSERKLRRLTREGRVNGEQNQLLLNRGGMLMRVQRSASRMRHTTGCLTRAGILQGIRSLQQNGTILHARLELAKDGSSLFPRSTPNRKSRQAPESAWCQRDYLWAGQRRTTWNSRSDTNNLYGRAMMR